LAAGFLSPCSSSFDLLEEGGGAFKLEVIGFLETGFFGSGFLGVLARRLGGEELIRRRFGAEVDVKPGREDISGPSEFSVSWCLRFLVRKNDPLVLEATATLGIGGIDVRILSASAARACAAAGTENAIGEPEMLVTASAVCMLRRIWKTLDMGIKSCGCELKSTDALDVDDETGTWPFTGTATGDSIISWCLFYKLKIIASLETHSRSDCR
jgi:hypothetical protein